MNESEWKPNNKKKMSNMRSCVFDRAHIFKINKETNILKMVAICRVI